MKLRISRHRIYRTMCMSEYKINKSFLHRINYFTKPFPKFLPNRDNSKKKLCITSTGTFCKQNTTLTTNAHEEFDVKVGCATY